MQVVGRRFPRALVGVLTAVVLIAAVPPAGATTRATARPASADAPSWTTTEVPLPKIEGDPGVRLGAITCPSSSYCVAVGSYFTSTGSEVPLVMTRTATTWTAQSLSVPVAPNTMSDGAVLSDVSCASPTSCMAVGTFYVEAEPYQLGLVALFQAGAWSTLQAPFVQPGEVNMASFASVACVPGGACLAAGAAVAATGTSVDDLYLLSWPGKGTTISAMRGPRPADAAAYPNYDIEDVACGNGGRCIVVGSYDGVLVSSEPLLVSVASKVASVISVPQPAGVSAQYSMLRAASCYSSTDCTAVGLYSGSVGGLFAVTDVMSKWKAVSLPVPTDFVDPGDIRSLECFGLRACTAAASYTTSIQSPEGVLLTETAGVWRKTAAPKPTESSPLTDLSFPSIACDTHGTCVAPEVVRLDSRHVQTKLLSETAGVWTLVPSPLPAGATPDYPGPSLSAVACFATARCLLIGSYLDAMFASQAVAVSWSSGKTGVARLGLPAGSGARPLAQLTAVSCGALGHCAAAGSLADRESGMVVGALEDRLVNGVWSSSVALLPESVIAKWPQSLAVAALSCVSAWACSAAGTVKVTGVSPGQTPASVPVAFSFNSGAGSSTVLPYPADINPSEPAVSITGLGCSPTRCAAIGSANTTTSVAAIAYTETAGAWSETELTTPGNGGAPEAAQLQSVSCPPTGACEILGRSATGLLALFTENGSTWAYSQPETFLAGAGAAIDCLATDACTAVSEVVPTSPSSALVAVVLVEASGSWSEYQVSGALANASLSSVSCVSTSTCTAVGTTAVSSTGSTTGVIVNRTGSTLSVAAAPGRATGVQVVSCAIATSCAAEGAGELFAETGGTWAASQVALPSDAAPVPQTTLYAATCSTSGLCIVAGTYYARGSVPSSLLSTVQLGA